MNSFSKQELVLLRKLNTPAKVQDFLNSLRFNFETKGATLKSPLLVLQEGNAHCIEGAILGAFILSLRGHKPFILHLKTVKEDYEHVIAPFKLGGLWGALSKTNHAVLRYREPVYKSIRELVMSYFHEYYLENGMKTLRSYSKLLNLNIFEKGWETSGEDLWGIDEELDKIKHYEIIPKSAIKNLRKVDKIEIKVGDIPEYKK